MPALKNDLHERYAQRRADGLTQSLAYERAGGSGDRSYSAKVDARPDVQGRIAELIAERQAANPTDISEMKGAEMLRVAAKTAMQTNNLTALVQAGKELASYDGSGEELNPPDSHAIPVHVLAAQMVPMIRDILWKLVPGKPLPADDTIKAAILYSLKDSFDVPSAASDAPVA